jgi:tetratricopeptide (TPR) repeat protein
MLSEEDGDMGENHFLEALQLNPKDAAARFNLGRAYLKQGRYTQALDYMQLAELETPNLWLIHIYKGRARSQLGNHEEARSSFKTALELDEERWLSHIYYSLFLFSRQEKAEAQQVLLRMLTKDPDHEKNSPPPWGFFQEPIDYTEYLSVFSHVMADAAGATRTIGQMYIRSLQTGKLDFKKLEEYGKKGYRHAWLVALRKALEQPDGFLAGIVESFAGDLGDFGAYAYVLRAQAQARMGNQGAAEGDFKTALQLEPSSAVSHYSYAKFLKDSGRLREAQTQLHQLLGFHPQFIPAIIALQKNGT